jgi:pSer/pThr/pTyr-binding forkhead associated (FHA) protein
MSNMSSEPALELFRKACGLSAPLALVCQDASSSAGAYTPLDYPRPFMLIGRLPTADLSLNHDRVSRRHVYLQAVEGRVYCIDLESRTKTHWKGEEVAQSQGWLDPRGSIQVGPYVIHRTDLPPDGDPPSGMADPFSWPGNEGSDPPHLPRPTLELPFRVDGRSSTWAPQGLMALMGRSDRCQLVLTDNAVSQYHACLVRTPLGAWIIDLAAREGIYVNEMRVRWAWLAEGDQVRMGPFTIVVRYETSPEGISRLDVPLVAGASPTAPPAHSLGVAPGPFDNGRKALAVRSGVRAMGLARVEPPAHVPRREVQAVIDGAEWEPVLPPGPNPGAVWQQQVQMMQSFHNDMVMMFQMFVAMHREHLGSVRDELDRVQQLTRELTRLNARLGQLQGSAETITTSEAGRSKQDAGPVPQAEPSRPGRSPLPRRRTGEKAERKPSRNPDDKPMSNSHPVSGAMDQGKPQSAQQPAMNRGDTYADLTRRITEIQRERQGYWQSILKAINK